MKKYILASIILVVFSLLSCTKDAPKANDETAKGHENPQKVVIRFTEGKEVSENGEKYLETIQLQESKNPKIPIVQEYVLERTKKGVAAKNNKPILLVKGKSYGLEIFYYNKKNELMNHEFITPEMSPIHQHFFMPGEEEEIEIKGKKVKIFNVNKKDVITYFYRDTQPYNKKLNENGVILRKKNNPIGLKGYFTVNKGAQSFGLKVVLVHVTVGNKLDGNGNPYPFHSPSVRVLGVTDLSTVIPMRIFTSSDSPNYESDISKEFNIPSDKVKEAIIEREKLFKESPKIKF